MGDLWPCNYGIYLLHIKWKRIFWATKWYKLFLIAITVAKVMVDFVTTGKPKITWKLTIIMALTLKPYNVWCWNLIWIDVSVVTTQVPSLVQICDGHYFSCVDLTWNDPSTSLNLCCKFVISCLCSSTHIHLNYGMKWGMYY